MESQDKRTNNQLAHYAQIAAMSSKNMQAEVYVEVDKSGFGKATTVETLCKIHALEQEINHHKNNIKAWKLRESHYGQDWQKIIEWAEQNITNLKLEIDHLEG
jgi:hypothetical protein